MTDAYKMEYDGVSDALTRRAKHKASEGEHVVERSITRNADQVLTLADNDEDKLRVATNDYWYIEHDGAYWCSGCDTDFDSIEEAHEHLKKARRGEI